MNWNLPKQTHLVENGQAGDCWRCCIAAILQVPAESVPHFLEEAKKFSGRDMYERTQKWLNERGFCLVRVPGGVFFDYMWHEHDQPLPVIACGPTERSRGMHKHHAVVMCKDKMVYDPHPSEAGLTAITEYYLVVPLWDRFHLVAEKCNCGGLCPACAGERKGTEAAPGAQEATLSTYESK